MAEILSTLSSDGLAGTPTETGQRYTLISTWEGDQQQDLVLGGNTAVLECYKGTTIEGGWNADGSLNDSVNVNGWTTDASHYVTIKAAAGNENNGVSGAGFTLTSINSTNIVSSSEDYTRILDIEVVGTRISTSAQTCINFTSNDMVVSGVISGGYGLEVESHVVDES